MGIGDEVCAPTSDGTNAKTRGCPGHGVRCRFPCGTDLITAAALPEAACTVWSNLIDIAGLVAGDVLLVHGGAGGIGTFATQAGRAIGARVIERWERRQTQALSRIGCRSGHLVSDGGFCRRGARYEAGRGVDVILDNMGAPISPATLKRLLPTAASR